MARVILIICTALIGLVMINSCQENKIKVACVGDSITKGYLLEKPLEEAYPAQLQALLGEQFQVGNFGVNGATLIKLGALSYWDVPEFDEAIAFNPDIVVIMLGTNDSNTENWAYGVADFEANYTDFIKTWEMLASKPQIYLCTPAPAYSDFANVNDSVISQLIIPVIRQQSMNYDIKLIDINAALANKKELFPTDGIHPTADGASIIAQTVFSSLNKD